MMKPEKKNMSGETTKIKKKKCKRGMVGLTTCLTRSHAKPLPSDTFSVYYTHNGPPCTFESLAN